MRLRVRWCLSPPQSKTATGTKTPKQVLVQKEAPPDSLHSTVVGHLVSYDEKRRRGWEAARIEGSSFWVCWPGGSKWGQARGDAFGFLGPLRSERCPERCLSP